MKIRFSAALAALAILLSSMPTSAQVMQGPPTARPSASPTPALAASPTRLRPRAAVPRVAFDASRPITLDVRDARVGDVLAMLSFQSGKNIIADGSIPSNLTVSLRIDHVPFYQALDILSEAYDIASRDVDGTLVFGTTATSNARTVAMRFDDARSSSLSRIGVFYRTIPLVNARAADLAPALVASLPRGTIVVPDERTRTIYIKGSYAVVQSAASLVAALDSSASDGRASTIKTYRLRAIAPDIAKAAVLAGMTGSYIPQIISNPNDNTVIVAGAPDQVDQAFDILRQVDRHGKQVAFEVRVIDVTPQDDTSNIGTIFGGVSSASGGSAGSTAVTPGAAFTSFLNQSIQINATLNALIQKGHAQILESPTITALNNQKGSLLVGQTIPIVYYDPRTATQTVQFVNAGVKIDITPLIGDDDKITTKIHAEYSQVVSYQSGYPVIGTRQVDTFRRADNNQTIVIAGLLDDIQSDTVTRLPFLSSIPIIGPIFTNRQKSHIRDEIGFLITPRIIEDGVPVAPTPTLVYPTAAPKARH